jgi:hypothetical protein
MNMRKGALLLPALLAGCVSAPAVQQPVRVQSQAPAVVQKGLESVMGQTARSLETQFGTADLDVREGAARKLQFANPVCVLDAYLYPPAQGREPVVTHIDARQPNGLDFDRASCIASLHQGH